MKRGIHVVWLAIACFARAVVIEAADSTCVENSAAYCQKSSDAVAGLTSALCGHSERLDALSDVLTLIETCSCRGGPVPQDCSDVDKARSRTSGVYQIYIPNNSIGSRFVYCDLSNPGANYLVFQRRKDGSENFERTWKEYADGFGNLNGEFWLGNDVLHVLTNTFKYKLRIDLEDFDGQKRYAEYSSFTVGPSADNYRLNVSGYSGDAGDNLVVENGQQFSTIDADHDKSGTSCAKVYHGAWWYNACHTSNLNGLYLRGEHKTFADGIEWKSFRGHNYSLKTTEMKIVRV